MVDGDLKMPTSWFLIWILFVVGVTSKERIKRRVVFPKGSKFFVRLNFKADVVTYTPIFAFAAGFKMTWDLPDSVRKTPFHRRAVYDDVRSAIDGHGLNGSSCLLKFICEAAKMVDVRGDVYLRILKLIFTVPEGHPMPSDCQQQDSNWECPLSLQQLSAITQFHVDDYEGLS